MLLTVTIAFFLLACLVIWVNMETLWPKVFWYAVLVAGMVLIHSWERVFVPIGIVVLLATYQSFRYRNEPEEK